MTLRCSVGGFDIGAGSALKSSSNLLFYRLFVCAASILHE